MLVGRKANDGGRRVVAMGRLLDCEENANMIWIGPNVNNESNDTPDGCTVEQVAYVVRHGSRYPDTGAYNEWVALHTKVSFFSFPQFLFFVIWEGKLRDRLGWLGGL